MASRDPDLRVEALLASPAPPAVDDLAALLAAHHPRIDRRWQLLTAAAVVCAGFVLWRGCATAAAPAPMHTAVLTAPGEEAGGVVGDLAANGSASGAASRQSSRNVDELAPASVTGISPDDGTGPPSGKTYSARPAPRTTSMRTSSPRAASTRVDLNATTAADLDALPGIGPVLAQRIIAWRSQHGRFSDVHELLEVKGIGPSKFAKLSALVRVSR